jgi:hypothetical protein
MVLGHLGHHRSGRDVEIILREDSVQKTTYDLATRQDVASIDFISAGISSRKGLILRLIKDLRIPVRVLLQDPQVAISHKERVSSIKALCDIATEIGRDKWNSPDVQFQFYVDRASVRATLFRDENGTVIYGILGWYTYHNDNSALSGGRHPAVFLRELATPLIQFANDQFLRRWNNQTSLDYAAITNLDRNLR